MSAENVKARPSAEDVRSLLQYDLQTGEFFWRRGGVNSICVGDSAGHICRKGYLNIKIARRHHRAHRLAWLYVYGTWPGGMIDHINGLRTDNRIANLRLADRHINAQNRRVAQEGNRSGLLGVRYVSTNRTNPYIARIHINGRLTHLGSFPTAQAAHSAYVDMKRRVHSGCTL